MFTNKCLRCYLRSKTTFNSSTTVMFHGTAPCICHIFNQIKVFGLYRCIAIFALRLIWNYPYSPFYRKYLELVFFYLYKYWAWYFAKKSARQSGSTNDIKTIQLIKQIFCVGPFILSIKILKNLLSFMLIRNISNYV